MKELKPTLRERAALALIGEGDGLWRMKQFLASGRYYGDGGTWHSSDTIDVRTDAKGNVVQVWFRCQMLKFSQSRGGEWEAEQGVPVRGVEVVDDHG